VRAFVPIMLRQGTEGHVVNTASIRGLTTGAWVGSYEVSKHGVVALSESLARELAQIGAPIKVSVLRPGGVRTNIVSAARNRPPSLANSAGADAVRPEAQAVEDRLRPLIEEQRMPPAQIADLVVAAIRAERFYLLPHPQSKAGIRARMEAILAERNPSP
jgi:NAD(P)-dependent dehydrogenase (short-subunit alcohol dehydrogenase family)